MRRRLVFISGVAALSVGAWYWYRSQRQTPQAVSPQQPGQGGGSSQSFEPFEFKPFDWGSPIDWLKLDFEPTYFPISSAETEPGSLLPSDKGSIMSRGISNNNPLNIEATGTQWQGAVGDDGRFIIFETPFYGIRAAARIMRTYRNNYGLNTIRDIVSRWAPPVENPTENYINYVEKSAGVNADSPLGADDYPKVIAAMIHFENGYNPYESNLIAKATATGLN